MKTVSAAYAKANFPSLLKEVEAGKTIVVSRYKKPVAILGPAASVQKPQPRFGTGRDKVRLIDPHAFDPMTDEEVDAFLEGRY